MSSSGDAGRGPRPSAAASWSRSATATRKRPRPTFSAGTAPLVSAAKTRAARAPSARAASSTFSRPSLLVMLGPSAVGAGDEAGAVTGAVAPGQVAVPARHSAAAAQAPGTLLALEKGATAIRGEVAEGDGVGQGSLGRHGRGDHLGIRDKGGERRTWPGRWDGGPTTDRAAMSEVGLAHGSPGRPSDMPRAGRRRGRKGAIAAFFNGFPYGKTAMASERARRRFQGLS